MKPRVAIVGAGLLGRLLCWRLCRAGWRVSLFEKTAFARPLSAAHTAAAMVAPYSEVITADAELFAAGQRALSVWPRWLSELSADGGPAVAYSATGSLAIAHPQDRAELVQFERDIVAKLGAEHGAQWLDGAQLATLEPALGGRFERGLLLPGEAYLDNRGLLAGLLEVSRALGAELREQSPMELADFNGTGWDWVLDCRGLGASDARLPVRGVRGEVLWVETREISFQHALRLMHPRYQLYIVPKPGRRFIIGATEIESEDASPVSVRSLLELGSALYAIHPAFAEARVLELDANLRPSLPDNRIRLVGPEVLPGGARLLRLNGLYRHGYLLAPELVTAAERVLLAAEN